MRRNVISISGAVALVLCGAPIALAQNDAQDSKQAGQQADQAKQADKPPVILLRDWKYDEIYSRGWSAQEMLDDADVAGPYNDSDIGSVENVIVSKDGRALGIIAQVGGFLGIGDTNVFVPWAQIEFSDGLDRVEIPVTQENVEDFVYEESVLKRGEASYRQAVETFLETGPRVWKATELLDDRVFLNGNVGYGWVSDLIFTNEGELHAVIVNADAKYNGGYYAYPYYGFAYGWAPGAPYYSLPYDPVDVARIELFDYDKMNDNLAMQNDAKDKQTTGRGANDDNDGKSRSSSE